jgi:WD40 repeat protein/Tfp pilus assembly protein PilF
MMPHTGSTEGKLKVFISYSRKDVAFAQRIVSALEVRGVAPKIDTRDLPKLEDWRRELLNFIREADAVIFIVSTNSISSPICSWEVEQVAKLNKRLAPIVLERVCDDRIPEAIAKVNYVFFDQSDDFESQCDELARALQTDIVWLKEHTRLGELARRWDERRRSSGWTLRGQELRDAEHWIASRPRGAPQPTETTRNFLGESRRAATKRRNILTGSLAAGFIFAVALASGAFWQRTVAVHNEERAIASEDEAKRNEAQAKLERDEALTTQSRFLADQSRQRLLKYDVGTALVLALEALPGAEAGISRPYVPEAEVQLDHAWRLLRERSIFTIDADSFPLDIRLDASLVVTRSANANARMWNANTDEPIIPDTEDNTLRLWDVAAGAQIGQRLIGHSNFVTSAIFSADGKRVVTTSHDHTARIWDARTGAPLGNPLLHPYEVLAAAFSPDGTKVVTGSSDHKVREWDVATGSMLGAPFDHGDSVEHLAFSHDGRHIVSASSSLVRIWDSATGKQIGKSIKDPAVLWAVALSPDGARLVTASETTARIWNATTGQEIGKPLIGHTNNITSAAFSPDGKWIVTASEDKTARIWSAATGAQIGDPLGGHTDSVLGAAFSPDGNSIVTFSVDKTVRYWNVVNKILSNERLEGDFEGSDVSQDWKYIVTPLKETARLWNAETKQPVGKLLVGHTDLVEQAAFSRDGKYIVTASRDGTARLWDTATQEPIGGPLKGHVGAVWDAEFSPDGKWIVTASQDNTARIWSVATATQVGEPLECSDGVTSASFSPDGNLIVTTSVDGTVRLWASRTGTLVAPIIRLGGYVRRAAFSPDGTRIVTAGAEARIWDAATGAQIGEPLAGHTNDIESATFNADGTRIVTASIDQTVRVWAALSGKPTRAPLESAVVQFLHAAFSPDGTRILATSLFEARIWKIFKDDREFVARAKEVAPRCLSPAERKSMFLPPQPPLWCIELQKWPYQTASWQRWLSAKRAGKDAALPDKSNDSKIAYTLDGSGEDYYNKRDYDRAIAQYTEAIRVDSKYVAAYIDRAKAHLAKKDYDLAIADYSEAIRVDPSKGVSFNGRCWARTVLGRDLLLALADCNESLRLRPDSADTLDSRALAELKLGQLDKALADYDSALKIDPKLPSSLYGRGVVKQKMGDVVGARVDLAAAKTLDPGIMDAWAEYGLK